MEIGGEPVDRTVVRTRGLRRERAEKGRVEKDTWSEKMGGNQSREEKIPEQMERRNCKDKPGGAEAKR